MRFRRQRDWSELIVDPQTPYRIGRLLGANEMAVALLSREQNEVAVRVAEVLERVGAHFFDDAPAAKTRRELELDRPPGG